MYQSRTNHLRISIDFIHNLYDLFIINFVDTAIELQFNIEMKFYYFVINKK